MKRFYAVLIAGCSLMSTWAHAADTPVAKLGNTVFTEEDMKKELGYQLYQAENGVYAVKRAWVDQKAQNILFNQAAKAAGLSREAWEAKEIDAKAGTPDANQVLQLSSRFARPGTSPEEATKAATNALLNQMKQARRAALYTELQQKTPLEFMIIPPATPIVDTKAYPNTAPTKGPAKAAVTIIEYTDYECPWCKKSQENLKEVEKAYKGRVKFVARNFPLTQIHQSAQPAAEASVCAQEQGKFWPYRDKLFEKQPQLSAADLENYAKEVGLNVSKFKSCVASHKYKDRVEADVLDGQRVGVRGTPSFFVNGTQVGFPELMNTVKAELDKAK